MRINNYSYDNKSRLFKQTALDADGVIMKNYYYCYNQKGERIRKTTRDYQENLKGIRLYIYSMVRIVG